MKPKNNPFNMDEDDVAILAMLKLRPQGFLSHSNLESFSNGYITCTEALCNVENLVDLLQYHHRQFSKTEDSIKAYMSMEYRRSMDAEERARIKNAENVCKAIEVLIEALKPCIV